MLLAPQASHAITGFSGPWDPSAAPLNSTGIPDVNGFNRAVQSSVSTFTVSISLDNQTLTALLTNNGDTNHPSFFLQNYSGLLPAGSFSYDYSIRLNSPTGFINQFDDFGNFSANYIDGTILSGTRSGLNPEPSLPYPFFGYFGINIDDGAGSAEATVVLTNFQFTPVPSVPGPFPIFGVSVAIGYSRRLRAKLKESANALRS